MYLDESFNKAALCSPLINETLKKTGRLFAARLGVI